MYFDQDMLISTIHDWNTVNKDKDEPRMQPVDQAGWSASSMTEAYEVRDRALPSLLLPYSARSCCEIDGKNGKVITLVRHAEGLHNQDCRGKSQDETERLLALMEYWDPPLTTVGTEQCSATAATVASNQEARPDLVVSSPLTRAIQTASLVYKPTRGLESEHSQPPIIATELARERISRYTCDGRRDRSVLRAEFPHVDFSEIPTEEDALWLMKEDLPDDLSATGCFERAAELMRWLHAREERHIAVVSHWVFLSHLLRLFPKLTKEHTKPFANAELRYFTLVSVPGADPGPTRLPTTMSGPSHFSSI